MKKSVLLLMAACCINMHAQDLFTLDKVLDGQYNVQFTQYNDDGEYEDQLPSVVLTAPSCDMGYYYYTECAENTYTLNLVNPDYTVISSKKYNLEIPSGYKLQNCYPTNQLTSDKSLLFFATYQKSATEGTIYGCGLYNEAGKLLQTFISDVKYVSVYSVLFKNNGSYKLMLWTGNYTAPSYTMIYKTYIYNFAASSTRIEELPESRLVPQQPSSSTLITIPYNNRAYNAPLLIFDANGKLIETQELMGKKGTAYVSTFTYQRGIYIYKIGEQSGKFIVN